MRSFISQSASLALALLGTAQAHTSFTTLFVDGVNQGDGVCVRMHNNPQEATFPIPDVTSKDVACGIDGEKGVARVCPVSAASTLTFEFREWPDGSNPGSIDDGHKGPCSVYMKKVDSAIADNNAAGDGWFKIWDSTYDDGKWCTEKMIENNGHISVKVPEDIAGGYYLVRTELLALHAAVDSPPDPQFYVGCAQVFVESTGTAKPDTVDIGEGFYDLDIPGLTYNIYDQPLKLPYPGFGPQAYKSKTLSSRRSDDKISTVGLGSPVQQSRSRNVETPKKPETSALKQKEGLKPKGCVMQNANWCGFEVPSYDNETDCWKSSGKCWDQSKTCWDSAPPTGGANCDLWDSKCNEIDTRCNAGNFHGPPHAGKDMTPTPPRLVGGTDIFTKRDESGLDATGMRRGWRHHRPVKF
ncbi:hypothetical protein FQN54_006679 [Arachnomyces sp. PD_36]|nr:hypothetical protein FQN54_006679 [Arachnomyces sp. PD_36]